MTSITQPLRATIGMLALSTFLFGAAYPAFCTLMLMHVAPEQSQGSLIRKDGKILGSQLIGQSFSAPQYFWGRLSATSPAPYNAASSSGSNLGAANPALASASSARIQALAGHSKVPADLATASGSGLDPDISPAAAEYQLGRVAKARNISEAELRKLVARYTQERQLGFLGEPRVNVLELNLALDGKL